jgi:hypothetical protein
MNIREHLRLGGLYLLTRLQEASTWRSLVIIGSAVTWHRLDGSSRGEVVMQAGLLVAGLIGAMLPDQMGRKP